MLAPFRYAGAIFALLTLLFGASTQAASRSHHTLRGIVESGGNGLQGYSVTLYASFPGSHGKTERLGRDVTDSAGKFEIRYEPARSSRSHVEPILYLQAEHGPAMLASVLREGPDFDFAHVNERTTVAMGTAFAQFVARGTIRGNTYGMLNAVHMAGNMADPATGTIADVLRLPPNGDDTTALKTFNSLANMVVACVAADTGCDALFDATTLPGGTSPDTVLQAIANIAKYPWLNVSALFDLSFETPVYAPARAKPVAPDSWAIFLKFTGSFTSEQSKDSLMNGAGAFAIDEKGFVWITTNYLPAPPLGLACAGDRLIKLYPWGENFPGSPYTGGGLSGAGYGITLAPDGKVWVGNFGFAGIRIFEPSRDCDVPNSNSVSVFNPDGTPVRGGEDGFTEGAISWPQATNSDPKGNIWIANCGSDSVTVYPKGKPRLAFNRPIPTRKYGQMKPFGLAIDHNGNAWVSGNISSTLAVIDPKGRQVEVIGPQDSRGRTQISRPMGVASDSHGNIWVSNSDWVDVPCLGGKPDLGPGTDPSIALFLHDPIRKPHKRSPFKGGGLTVPWGIAVDGNDTVWVANFGFAFDVDDPTHPPIGLNRVSQFCGIDTSKCPLSKQVVGAPISPAGTGYTSDSLQRNTAVAIDSSGNVWLANNWKQIPVQGNPGGNGVVVIVGAAGPLKTPLIGPPESFDEKEVHTSRHHR
jgi:hypothetical protein